MNEKTVLDVLNFLLDDYVKGQSHDVWRDRATALKEALNTPVPAVVPVPKKK